MSKQIGELYGEPIVTVTRLAGSNAVINSCPYCGERHTHGNGRLNDRQPNEYDKLMTHKTSVPQHRSCDCGEGGYWYVYTEDTRNVSFGENGLTPTDDFNKRVSNE